MKKSVLNEKDLRNIVQECIKQVLKENGTPETLADELQQIANELIEVQQSLERIPNFDDSESTLNFAIHRLQALVTWCNQTKSANFPLGEKFVDWSIENDDDFYAS